MAYETPYCRKARKNCLDQNCGCIPGEVLPNRHVEFVGMEAIVTIHWRKWLWFGKPEVKRYRGSGTVWHDADTGRRVSGMTESLLTDILVQAKWNRNERLPF